MEHNFQPGDICPKCQMLGIQKKLAIFYINVNESILKCESEICLYPYSPSDFIDGDSNESTVENIELELESILNGLSAGTDENSWSTGSTVEPVASLVKSPRKSELPRSNAPTHDNRPNRKAVDPLQLDDDTAAAEKAQPLAASSNKLNLPIPTPTAPQSKSPKSAAQGTSIDNKTEYNQVNKYPVHKKLQLVGIKAPSQSTTAKKVALDTECSNEILNSKSTRKRPARNARKSYPSMAALGDMVDVFMSEPLKEVNVKEYEPEGFRTSKIKKLVATNKLPLTSDTGLEKSDNLEVINNLNTSNNKVEEEQHYEISTFTYSMDKMKKAKLVKLKPMETCTPTRATNKNAIVISNNSIVTSETTTTATTSTLATSPSTNTSTADTGNIPMADYFKCTHKLSIVNPTTTSKTSVPDFSPLSNRSSDSGSIAIADYFKKINTRDTEKQKVTNKLRETKSKEKLTSLTTRMEPDLASTLMTDLSKTKISGILADYSKDINSQYKITNNLSNSMKSTTAVLSSTPTVSSSTPTVSSSTTTTTDCGSIIDTIKIQLMNSQSKQNTTFKLSNTATSTTSFPSGTTNPNNPVHLLMTDNLKNVNLQNTNILPCNLQPKETISTPVFSSTITSTRTTDASRIPVADNGETINFQPTPIVKYHLPNSSFSTSAASPTTTNITEQKSTCKLLNTISSIPAFSPTTISTSDLETTFVANCVKVVDSPDKKQFIFKLSDLTHTKLTLTFSPTTTSTTDSESIIRDDKFEFLNYKDKEEPTCNFSLNTTTSTTGLLPATTSTSESESYRTGYYTENINSQDNMLNTVISIPAISPRTKSTSDSANILTNTTTSIPAYSPITAITSHAESFPIGYSFQTFNPQDNQGSSYNLPSAIISTPVLSPSTISTSDSGSFLIGYDFETSKTPEKPEIMYNLPNTTATTALPLPITSASEIGNSTLSDYFRILNSIGEQISTANTSNAPTILEDFSNNTATTSELGCIIMPDNFDIQMPKPRKEKEKIEILDVQIIPPNNKKD